MNLTELIVDLENFRSNSSWDKLREEKEKLDVILVKLQNTSEIIVKLKNNIDECKKNDIEEVNSEINYILSILKSHNNDALSICNAIERAYERSDKCIKKMNEIKSKLIIEYSNKLKEYNRKIFVYFKIFNNILKIDIDIPTFETSNDVKELQDEISQAEKELNNLYERLKNELSKSNLTQEYVNLLLEFLSEGEITISKKNSDKVLKLLEFLLSKNIPIKVRI
jgi:predicted transcriptional regulator